MMLTTYSVSFESQPLFSYRHSITLIQIRYTQSHVLDTEAIGPGENHTYRYNIPCNHAGGTFWWHPHHHGATHLQVSGGAAGHSITSVFNALLF